MRAPARWAARVAAWMVAGLVAAPLPALAHLVETGFGAYYDGLAHVVLTPADLLLVLGVALLAGQRGKQAARRMVFILPLAWLAGGCLGAAWPAVLPPPLATTVSFALAGALVALDAPLRPLVVAGLAGALGLLHGLANGATMAPGGASPLALAGAVTTVFALASLLAAEVSALAAGWQRVAVRVGGSWIAAGGVLASGWLLR